MAKRRIQSVYFTSLAIENVRCFGDRQELDLTAVDGRPARWTLILGDNGVGKTTLLQCLAWMQPVREEVRIGKRAQSGPSDQRKTKAQLIQEVEALREQVAAL